MLDFRAIELADVRNFMKHWELTAQRSSDYCFPILWGWAETEKRDQQCNLQG